MGEGVGRGEGEEEEGEGVRLYRRHREDEYLVAPSAHPQSSFTTHTTEAIYIQHNHHEREGERWGKER